MKVKLLAVLLLGAVGVGSLLWAFGVVGASAADTPEYLTAPASIGDVTDDVAATGTIQPEASYGVLFGADPYVITEDTSPPAVEATYPVTSVLVQVGDTVKAGDELATADTADLERQLDAAKNDLASAKVSQRAADDERDDADASGSTSRIRQAKISQYGAENAVAAAQATVDDLKARIKGATITAPIDGLVTAVDIAEGFDAPSGPAIVIDSATFVITTDVVERDLADIEIGQDAAISIDAVGADVTGTVSAISPVAAGDGSVVSYPVTVTLASAPAEARAGMSADVTITIASATGVLTVPASALRGTEGDYRVMTLAADGTTTLTPVEVGLVTSTAAEITSGLSEGTAVVTGTASDLVGTANQNGGITNGVAIPGAGPGRGEFRGPIVQETRP